jgi:hypothetical protein
MAAEQNTTRTAPRDPPSREGGRPSPADAELLAVCAQFEALEHRMRAIGNNPGSLTDQEAEAQVRALDTGLNPLLDRLGELKAATASGIHARAHLLAVHNPNNDYSFDYPDSVAGRLLRYLRRDAMALPLVADSVDADLIRLCDQHIVDMDTFNQHKGATRAHEKLGRAYDRSLDAISQATPRTIAGIVAKARAAKHQATGPNGDGETGGSIAEQWALQIVNDLVRVGGVTS